MAATADNPAIRQAVTIAKPSVVFLYVQITGSLLDHRDGQVHGPYTTSSKGSGFFIDPGGDIVTATHVVTPTDDDLHTALVDRYIIAVTGNQLATNSPTFTAYMNATQPESVSTSIRVVTQSMNIPGNATNDDLQRLGLPATILAQSPVANLDTSVIHVSRTKQPAVLLHQGETAPAHQSMALMGYPQMAPTFSTAPEIDFGTVSDVRAVGSAVPPGVGVLPTQATVIVSSAYSEHGVSGGPGIDAQANVVGLVSFGAVAGTPIFLVSADDISGIVAKAGVTNALSDADRAWRNGVAAQQTGDQSAAAADFRTCIDESPDNTGCHQQLAQVTSSSSPSGGAPIVLIVIGAIVLVVVIAGGAAWYLRRPEAEDY
ncbi:MAG: serine protease [Candidatus Dormibacteraeota bacterium]|nr:serine protease [Candidatus Dormibacteraeota bacterium]